jgi:hypothetical protein
LKNSRYSRLLECANLVQFGLGELITISCGNSDSPRRFNEFV